MHKHLSLSAMALVLLTVGPVICQEPKLLQTLNDHDRALAALAFSPDGKTLASVSLDNVLLLYDTATWKAKTSLRGYVNAGKPLLGLGYDAIVWPPPAFSPDGSLLAIPAGAWFKVWDVKEGEIRFSSGIHDLDVEAIAFSPDGKTITSASGNSLMTTDVASMKSTKTPLKHEGNIQGAIASRDGTRLATWFFFTNRTTKVWDAETKKQLALIHFGPDVTGALTFSPDGKSLAVGVGKGKYVHPKMVWTGGEVHLFEIASAKSTATFVGHKAKVLCAAFSPDGKTLATGSHDKTVKLWEVGTGKELATLTAHTGQVTGVAFSPDGKLLATASADQTVRIWEIPERK